jgi:TIR domain
VAIMAESSREASGQVFMCYRREDTSWPAFILYDALKERFQVFKDVKSIRAGQDFVAKINKAAESSAVLLVLIGDRWLTIKDADNSRRIDNRKDYVRQEIEAALARDITIIPILVDGTRMPGEEVLPDSLAKLARRNGLDLHYDHIEPGLSRLVDEVDKTLSDAKQWITLYDSRDSGFSLSHFHSELYEGATEEPKLVTQEKDNDTLVIDRRNKDGQVVLWLRKYDYINSPNVIPRGDAWGKRRTFRVRCKVQAYDAAHTFNLMLKQVGTVKGIYGELESHRITPDTDILTPPIDDQFDVPLMGDCELRLEDRDVSAAPTRLEIRDLVVTERRPPPNLIPVAPN